jgi:hypothetical protein
MNESTKKKPKYNQAFALREDGSRRCLRCQEDFGLSERCANCGVHKDRRVIQHYRRGRPIGGKRGRNSGKVRKTK